MTRPRYINHIPETLATRVHPLCARRCGAAGAFLRTLFSHSQHRDMATTIQQTKLLLPKTEDCALHTSTRHAVVWMADDTCLIGRNNAGMLSFFPLPLRKGMHSSPTLLLKLLADTINFTWPDFVHTPNELEDTTLALPCWLAINKTWDHIPLEAPENNRLLLQRHINSLIKLSFMSHTDMVTYHFTVQGSCVDEDGQPTPITVTGNINTGANASFYTPLIRNAIHRYFDDIATRIGPEWFINTHISNDRTQDFVNPGTLMSLTHRGTLPAVSAHDRMELLSLFPSDVVRTIFPS